MKTCTVCGKELYRMNKTGLCAVHSQQALSVERTKPKPPKAPPRATEQTESLTVHGDSAQLETTVDRPVRSLEDLVAACSIDLSTWEVERYVCNKWEVGAKDASKQVVVTPLYQVKAWLKRKVAVIAAREEIAALLEDAKRAVKALPPPRIFTPPDGDLMLELAIPDLHAGKLSWGRETGYESYDTKIAVRLFEQAIDSLVARTKAFGTFNTILLPVGNDLLNVDNKGNTTTKGTPQSTDGRFHKTFTVVRQLLTDTIEQLRRIARVQVVIVPGNHDTMAAWHLGDSLQSRFHAHEDVLIDNEPTPRKYVRHGNVLLMFTHGDKVKLDKLPLIMATEQPEMFGGTRFREAHTGHLHQTRVQEHNGVRVRISPALCPPDAWHSESGFVGQQRAAEAYVWDADEGLVGTAVFTVPKEQK